MHLFSIWAEPLSAEAACGFTPANRDRVLRALITRAEGGPEAAVVCTREYAPVVADASGMWRGSPVAFRARYANSCAMLARTGAVFAF